MGYVLNKPLVSGKTIVLLAGVGFVFTADDPFCGIDLDKSIDASGTIKPWALDLLAKLDSYTEISPSGRGVKVFVKATKQSARCRKAYQDGGVEIYDRDRFFTVTGNRLEAYSVDIQDRQQTLDETCASVFGADDSIKPASDRKRASQASSKPITVLLDDEIIELASRNPRSGGKFRTLWQGDWKSECMNSASEADASVIFTLAYYTKDAAQIDRIFRRSGLMRSKWDDLHGDQSYGQKLIAKALSKVVKQYAPKSKRHGELTKLPTAELGFPKADIDWEFKSDQTENAMAVEFIDANQTRLRYVPSWKKWLAWDGKRWKLDIDSGRTMRLARRLVRNYWDRLQQIHSEKQQKDWADFCRWANRKTSIDNVVSLARCDGELPLIMNC